MNCARLITALYHRNGLNDWAPDIVLCDFGGCHQVSDTETKEMIVQDVQLEKLNRRKKKPPPPPPPPPPEPPKVEMAKFTPPKIVKDEEVKEMKSHQKLKSWKKPRLVQSTRKVSRRGIVAPPVSDAGKGVIEAPKKDERIMKNFTKLKSSLLIRWSQCMDALPE
jgi:hypothetical protein